MNCLEQLTAFTGYDMFPGFEKIKLNHTLNRKLHTIQNLTHINATLNNPSSFNESIGVAVNISEQIISSLEVSSFVVFLGHLTNEWIQYKLNSK